MNALRNKLNQNVILHKKIIMKSITLSTMMTTVSSFGTATASVALCEGKDDDQNNILEKIKAAATTAIDFDAVGQILGSKTQNIIDSGVPTQISYGFVCGFSSGYAMKKIGKVASVVFGLGFVTLQSLSYAGYINVDHKALQKDVENAFDLNNDGKVDDQDANIVYNKVMEVLQFNMTGGSGFAAGFVGGVRSG
mmetsp:Transcript_1657/g.2021  ORF Transcript_1657/g.2021 Transcript_1657/m.2021 type:complete len:194 (+) Transcript_1657:92-673(+)